MIFFTILGVIAFIYLLIGVGTLLWGIGSSNQNISIEEVKEDPAIIPAVIIGWPLIVMEELGLI